METLTLVHFILLRESANNLPPSFRRSSQQAPFGGYVLFCVCISFAHRSVSFYLLGIAFGLTWRVFSVFPLFDL